jgi:amidophosphoribosyltransferase
MCGITGILSIKNKTQNIFSELYESLFHLQHRGQDSAGFAVYNEEIKIYKKTGLINQFKTILDNTKGFCGIGHIRYSTNNLKKYSKNVQIQPVVYKKKYECYICHNGQINLTDTVKQYCNTHNISMDNCFTDSILFTRIFCYNLEMLPELSKQAVCKVIEHICSFLDGAFSIICIIKDFGFICFKDNNGIRPLSYGYKNNTLLVSSESVALSSQNYEHIKELYPDEILISVFKEHSVSIYKKLSKCIITPCIFEWIYLARAESIIYDVPVYNIRITMGELLAKKIKIQLPNWQEYDYIIPVPDTSRPYALSISHILQIPYIEALIKNRYIYRTFIMDSQQKRKSNLKRKLNVIPSIINHKNIIIVDDSIVRGNTMQHIIDLLKQTQVNKIAVVSCAPEIINTNKYGIDLPTHTELISYKYDSVQLTNKYQVEKVIFQSIENLYKSIQVYNKNIQELEVSIFNRS